MPNFPTSLDTLSTSGANITANVNHHPALHNDANAILNEVEKVLVGPVWFRPEQFGAASTYSAGVDDRTFVQAAINAAGAAAASFGSASVLLTRKYQLTAFTTGTNSSWHLTVPWDNVTIEGTGNQSGLVAAGGGMEWTYMLILGGLPKAARVAGDVNDWEDYHYFFAPNPTIYTLTGTIAEGATSVTLASAGDAANFAVGDYIAIRTGQTIDGYDVEQPDAEINKVVGIAGAVLTLAWPTVKSYAQEYYVSGTSGRTTTSVTANLAPFGVQNVNSRTATGFRLSNMLLDHRWTGHIIGGGNLDGVSIENVDVIGDGTYGAYAIGMTRNLHCQRGRIDLRDVGEYWNILGPDVACSDHTYRDLDITTTGLPGFLHGHEGAARITFDNVRMSCPNTASDQPLVSFRNRFYRGKLINCDLQGGGNTATVFVNEHCNAGGQITDNRIRSAAAVPIAVGGAGWKVSPNDCDTVRATNGLQTPPTALGPVVMETLSQRVSHDKQNVPLGRLPAETYVTNVRVQVLEAFNSDGTDNLTGGVDASPSALFSALDVSTIGIKTPTLGFIAGYNGAALDLELYYTNGGTEPSAGRAIVIVEYYRVMYATT